MRLAAKATLVAMTGLLLLALNCTAAELELKQAQEGPSFEKTVDFIKEKIKSFNYISCNGNGTVENLGGYSMLDINNACQLTMQIKEYNSDYVIKNIIVDLKRIPSVTTVVSRITCDQGVNTKVNLSGVNAMYTYDTNLAERTAKALNHLRKLCGAIDDPF